VGDTPSDVIRNYLLKDFFKDHCQKYSNRPIYWLFDSGKNNGFKALIYLHRYNEDTIGKMRADYLHKVQRVYENESLRMQDIIDNSTDNREIAFARKQKEKFTKQLLETKEYDEVLGHIALQRIPLDLDDGVVVNYQKFQNIEVVNNGRKVKKNLLVDIYKGKK
jgi:type II restriction/modification system DNA methylase subunit YeeA